MSYLEIAALDAMPLNSEPYDYLVVPHFIKPERFRDVVADYPAVAGPGAQPTSELPLRGQFKALGDELDGPAFRQAGGVTCRVRGASSYRLAARRRSTS